MAHTQVGNIPREELQGSEADSASDEVDLSEAQHADLDILISALKNGTGRPSWELMSSASSEAKQYWARWDMLRLRDRVLQRRWETTDGSSHMWLSVVPRTLRPMMLKGNHDALTGGHFGIKKTLQRLRQRFYWLGMRHDVAEWCKACQVCCAKKGPRKTPRAPLQIYRVGAAMERIAVDITGPLPVTASGNRYILVVAMDYFTKWPEAYAIPNQEATHRCEEAGT